MNVLSSHLVWAFANSIWQSAVVAATAWAALKFARRTSAALRYWVWCAVLAAAAALPVANAFAPARVVAVAPVLRSVPAAQTVDLHPPAVVEEKTSVLGTAFAKNVVAGPTHGRPLHPEFVTRRQAGSIAARPRVASTTSFAVAAAVKQSEISQDAAAFADAETWVLSRATWFVGVWGLLSLLLLARLAIGYARLRSVKRGLLSFDASAVAAAAVGRDVTIGASPHVDGPCVIGYLPPAIALPSALLDGLADADLDKILAHELAHVRRFDDWGNLVVQAVKAAMFANPVVHFVIHRLDVDREIACDDLVAAGRTDRLEYARCLTEIARRTAVADRLVPAVGFFPDRKQIIVRIEQLLDRDHLGSSRVGVVPLISLAASAVVVALLVSHQAPAFARTFAGPSAVPVATAAPAATAAAVATAAPASTTPAAASPPKPAAPPAAPASDTAPITALSAALAAQDAARAQAMAQLSAELVKMRTLTTAQAAAVRAQTMARMQAMRAHLRARTGPMMWSVEQKEIYRKLAENEARSSAIYRIDDVRFADQTPKAVTASAIAAESRAMAIGRAYAVSFDQGASDDTNTFLDAIEAAGYRNLSIDELIKLRDAGVTTQYLQGLKQYGMAPMPVDKLIQLADAGVTPQFLSTLAKSGYGNLSADSAIQLANSGVSATMVSQLAALGYRNLSVADLVEMGNSGVSPKYVQAFQALGYRNLAPHDLVQMADAGVTPSMIDALRQHGYFGKTLPSVQDLIKLANAGF